MTYALAAALQTALYQHLRADPGVSDVLGEAIYDALPTGPLPPLYLSIGAETVRDRSDMTGFGAEHQLALSIVTSAAGFALAKTAATAVCDALRDASFTLSRGRLIGMRFERAQAERIGRSDTRRITLTFVARVEES